MFNSAGTILETWSQRLYGRSMTLPTSRITPRAARVPKVTIWATWSFPYFSTT